MSVKEIIKEIVKNNGWLNGIYDFKDGDLMAVVNQPEKFQEATERTELGKLYADLKNYDGVFKFRNLLFFNDSQYGTFVYDINNPDRKDYIEHLTMSVMPFDHFVTLINDLIEKSKTTPLERTPLKEKVKIKHKLRKTLKKPYERRRSKS